MTNESVVAAETRYPRAETASDFVRNIAHVRTRIADAAQKVGRLPSEIRLLPVSKTVPEEKIRLAAQAGCTTLGENKVQEAKRKCDDLADLGLRWSIIGHLQTNKAKDVVAFADEFQALDSVRIAEALDRRLQVAGRSLDVYVQVNTSAEESKFGVDPDRVLAFLSQLRRYQSLRVRGLMTLATLTPEAERRRACFRRLRSVRDLARERDTDLIGDGELSMGMSGDYEMAVEEGATVVRVGQAIFGDRATPDSYYWPEPGHAQTAAS